MIYVFLETERITSEIYETLLNEAGVQRREKALRYRLYEDRVSSLCAHRLLCNALKRSGVEFEIGRYGKPFIKGIHFSITHCRGCVAAVVSKNEVGIDVERVAPLYPEIMSEAFTKRELELIQGSEKRDEVFFLLWTLKESYVKMLGEGLNFPLKNVEFTFCRNGENDLKRAEFTFYGNGAEAGVSKRRDILCSDKSCVLSSYAIDSFILSICDKKGKNVEEHQIEIVRGCIPE